MNVVTGFKKMSSVVGVLTKTDSNSPTPPVPVAIVYSKYIARLIILIMALFIFIWWPVDSFTPEGFDTWSTRMTELPDEVWYVLLAVILGWGTTEAMAARAVSKAGKATSSYMPDPTFDGEPDFLSGVDVNELDGRFANLTDDEDFLSDPAEPNPVIEDWRNNASG